MSISLFSGQNQPYGLLSNNAFTPIMIDKVRYFSVTDYVYRNLFTNPDSKELMIKRLNRNPYLAAVEIKTDADKHLFIEAIVLGMKARFARDAKFKAGVKALGDGPISVKWGTEDEDRRLTMLFNQFIHSPEQVFFDETHGAVSFETVNAVVVGVAEKLLKDSQLPSLPFSKLLTYSVRNAEPRRDLVSALANLDEIVPVLKIKLKDKIYANELERFKSRVLDVTLNYVLKTSYPHIAEDDYARAKVQQIFKNKPVILKYETDLYNLYVNRALPPAIMNNADLARLNPNVPVSSVVTVNAIEAELEASNPNLPGIPTALEYPAYIGGPQLVPGELLPHAKTRITINNAEYDSVVAYAYSVLFESIKRPSGHVPLEKLAETYSAAEHESRVTRLKYLNEKATRAKFAADASLVQLLLATDTKKLIYSDTDDAVLGIRAPTGMNAAGEFLEVLRTEYAAKVKLNADRFKTPFDNIVVKDWFMSRALDYANTLKMFKIRRPQDLAMIYNIRPAYINSISEDSKKLMNTAGLSDVDQSLVMPFMVADFINKIQDGGIPAICASYDQHQPTKDERFNAETLLTKIYNIVKPRLYQQDGGHKHPQMKKITSAMFVTRILSNQEDGTINQDQWWRINKWNKQSSQVLLRLGE